MQFESEACVKMSEETAARRQMLKVSPAETGALNPDGR